MLKASASRSAAQPQATTAAADQGSHGTGTIEDGSGLTSPHVGRRSNSSSTGIKGKIHSRCHFYFSVATRRKILHMGLAFLVLWVFKKIVEEFCQRFFMPLELLYPVYLFPPEGRQPFLSFFEFNHEDEKLLMET